MEMHRDMVQCMSLAQVDDTKRHSHVKAAHEVIYVIYVLLIAKQ
jgi:hypothetical protein